MKVRLLTILLALVVIISTLSVITVLGESKTVNLKDGYYRYENDFNAEKDSITRDPTISFIQQDEFEYEEGKLRIRSHTWGLFSLAMTLGEKPYVITLDVSSKEVQKTNTFGAAFNVRGNKNSNFMEKGITFIIKNNKLTVLERRYEIATIKLPFSFNRTMRKVYIEDNLTDIKLYANNDKQVKTLLATIEFKDNNLVLIDAEGEERGFRKDPRVPSTGYFTFMSNYAEVALDNLAVEYYKEPYIPVDISSIRDTFYDTWVVTDALGRVAPVSTKDTQKDNKIVGIYYSIWHENTGRLYDHNRAYNEGGLDAAWEMLRKGSVGYGHYWAEPYFGYYRSDDEWVIRKHTNMLVNAGVDFVYFNMSNGNMYEPTYLKILDIWKQMREEGSKTPQFVCYLGDSAYSGYNMIIELWNMLYKHGTYKDLWFKWEGKPLVLGNLQNVPDEIKWNLTIRRSSSFTDAGWYTESNGRGKWPLIAFNPQMPGKNIQGIVEQVVVSPGYYSNLSKGRSYHENIQPTDGKNGFEFELETTPYGLAFKEQWEHAIGLNPSIIMITGWNEWWSGRLPGVGVSQKIANTYRVIKGDTQFRNNYVDCFNPEFSRDIEPMKGGFGDNYYYQMVSYIRQFKGTRANPIATGARSILINNDFSQWENVGPEFRDTVYDTVHRDHLGNTGKVEKLNYINTSGRNDINYAKVTHDDKNMYFHVSTTETMTIPEGENWMNLFIDIDQDASTGWEGYDFLINRFRDSNSVSVEKCLNDTWSWERVYEAEYYFADNKLHLSIPLEVLGITAKSNFDFKWADNSTTRGNIMEFMDLGDSAPDDRFNFRYIATPYASSTSKTVVIAITLVAICVISFVLFVYLRFKKKLVAKL